jgi:hypothetical protein
MDPLDYIRVRGLEDSESEVFQGAGVSGADSPTPGAPDDIEIDTTEMPDDLVRWIEEMSTIDDALETWVNDCFALAEANYVNAEDQQDEPLPPAPIPRPLPLPLPGTWLRWLEIILYVLRRQWLRLIIAIIRLILQKRKPPIGFPDPLIQAVKDLNFNTLEMALPGGGRVHLTGKWIRK